MLDLNPSQFNFMVVAEDDAQCIQDISKELPEQPFWTSYKILDEKRDWLSIGFVGEKTEGVVPDEFTKFQTFLASRGFGLVGRTMWGAQRFEKVKMC